MADHWTHHDAGVRAIIAEQRAAALRLAALEITLNLDPDATRAEVVGYLRARAHREATQ